MQVIGLKHLEDCFDGSFIREALLDEPVSRELIAFFNAAGNLQYYPDFPRPFFSLDVAGRFMLRGIQGGDTLRLILYRDNLEEGMEDFLKWLQAFERFRRESG